MKDTCSMLLVSDSGKYNDGVEQFWTPAILLHVFIVDAKYV